MNEELAEVEGSPDRVIGEVFANRYQIELKLGEGAMGAVYKARHVKVGRPFAVKLLHKHLLEERKILQRFEREAELAGRLRHPNVIGVVDVGETDDGYRFMVMDFAEGVDLATLLCEAPMPAERIIHLVRQMLEGLYHAHEAGLIHRDFKPENVIVERDDHGLEVPRIVDFGIAILREGGESAHAAGRLTTNGLVLGTPHYMAPEQAVADPIDHRIDLFALGIVIYEMLCGRLPFDGTGAEVARANLLLDPPLIAQRVPYLEVDPLLEAFARKLMAKKRELRPATAKAARELLDLIANDRPAAAVALGVPLVASSRQPAVTQPVTPHVAADETDGSPAKPPEIVELPAGSLEAPPMARVAYSVASPARSQREIPTDLSDPIAKRRTGIIAAVLGLSIAAIATVIVIEKTRSTGAPAIVDEGTKVVMTPAPPPPPAIEPVAKEPDRPPVPIDEPVAPPAPADERVAPPKADEPPAKQPARPPAKKQVALAKVEPPKVEPPKVEPPKPAGIDNGALSTLYKSVGADLEAVTKSRGAAVSAPYVEKYRFVNLFDAMSSQAKRDAAAAALNQLRAQLAPLKKQP